MTVKSALLALGFFGLGGVFAQNEVQDSFAARMDAFVEETVYSSSCGGIHEQAFRLNFDDAAEFFCAEAVKDSLDDLNQHHDGHDFNMPAYSWIMNRFWDSETLKNADGGRLRLEIVNMLINMPYWMEEGGEFNDMQFWSENHHIGWTGAAYLIGHAFDSIQSLRPLFFSASGLTGAELRDISRDRVLLWLEYRAKFGITEYNSDTYGGYTYRHLLALSHLAPDEEIRTLAKSIQTLLEFDHILGSKGDRLCTARGRAYEGGKIEESHQRHLYLLKGYGEVPAGDDPSIYLALNYLNGDAQPSAILEIGETIDTMEVSLQERFAIPAADGPSEADLDLNPVQDCWFWLTDAAYFTPEYPECMFVLADEFDLWERSDFWAQLIPAKEAIWDVSPELLHALAQQMAPWGSGPVFGPANMVTYRTKDFLSSSVQNHKPGYLAGQQQPWQITYDIDTGGTVFVTQPMCDNPRATYYWWSGILPKLAQFGATTIAIFNPDDLNRDGFQLNMTHAHFDQDGMDEVDNQISDEGGWIFGRYNEFYIGMFSWNSAEFVDDTDLVAEGIENVWIAEVGSASLNGSFENFKQNLEDSTVEVTIAEGDTKSLDCALQHKCMNTLDVEMCFRRNCGESLSTELEQCFTAAKIDDERAISSLLTLISPMDGGLFVGCGDEDRVATHLAEMTAADCLLSSQRQASEVEVTYVRGDGMTVVSSWTGDSTVDGHEIPSSDFPRYDNDFAQVDWRDERMEIESQSGYTVNIDFGRIELSFD